METGSNKAAPIATANENVHIHKLHLKKKEIAINICIESETQSTQTLCDKQEFHRHRWKTGLLDLYGGI